MAIKSCSSAELIGTLKYEGYDVKESRSSSQIDFFNEIWTTPIDKAALPQPMPLDAVSITNLFHRECRQRRVSCGRKRRDYIIIVYFA